MDKKYQVFVSSTYTDLINERKEVTQALLESNCIPTGMELFPAASKEQWAIIKGVIEDCDYYLIIIAGRYGSLGTDDSGKRIGYTEMEFDYAVKLGKPIIAFIHGMPEKIPACHSEESKTGKQRLAKFIKKVKTGRMVHSWDNKDNLKAAVLTSMPAAIKIAPATGWIRADRTCSVHNIPTQEGLDNNAYSGTWTTITEQGFIDKLFLKYNEKRHTLSGTIKRISPDKQANREWTCSGCVVGESIVIIYHSHVSHSSGCALVRHHRDNTYKGSYLRYNYATHAIEQKSLQLEKDMVVK